MTAVFVDSGVCPAAQTATAIATTVLCIKVKKSLSCLASRRMCFDSSCMRTHHIAIMAMALASGLFAAPETLPRTPGGKPNFEGIWQASSTAAADLEDHAARFNMLAGRSVVAGN